MGRLVHLFHGNPASFLLHEAFLDPAPLCLGIDHEYDKLRAKPKNEKKRSQALEIRSRKEGLKAGREGVLALLR